MGSIKIEGGHSLFGEVKVQGSKNAALPIMAATLLNGGISILKNFPEIEDVRQMQRLLESIGCRIVVEDDEMIIDSQPAKDTMLPVSMTGKIRASSVLLGPMLARFHHVKMAQPGGCRIGSRPLDIHMNVFKAFGASWELSEDYIEVSCVRLHPAQIRLAKKSVGATENAVMVASMIKGKSRISNAAMEPEITTLCEYLRNTGVRIQMDDCDTITVEGGTCSHATIEIPGDRIVAGTYMGAVTACGGKVTISGMRLAECRGFLNVFTGMGMELSAKGTDCCTVCMNGRPSSVNYVQTAPYPDFPTDMQSIVMACAAQADGDTMIVEKIFDHRLMVAEQLNKMGADISVEKECALVKGVRRLKGSTVCAEDLRGAAALVIAGMAADGITRIEHYEYLNRGYAQICEILNRLGANIHVE
ncbi:MAG: UDP-N-acetylglucosamine 1-carboxyvinyltransferase [Lachnospira sp.]|nr:UDP-N-acetylglucosamine 1-carboxyvinyltransferase [Lachnospira sp.]